MALLQILRPTLPILIGASLMLTLSMGLRQSFGIFMQPLTHDIGISVSQFTLALAVQNLAWGFLQPVAGAMTVRYGFRPIMIVGSLMYIVGLALMATAQGMIPILIGAGVLIGASLACTGQCDCDVGVGARGAGHRAQHRDGHGLGCRIARRIGVGAGRAIVE
jgi:MFS family permease